MADVQLSFLGAVIKIAYEGEPDTNAFSDAEKAKLAGIEAGATSGGSSEAVVGGAFNPAAVTMQSAKTVHSSFTQSGAVAFTLDDAASTFHGGEVLVPFTSSGEALTWGAGFVDGSTLSAADLPSTLPAGEQALIFVYDEPGSRALVYVSRTSATLVDYDGTTSGLSAANVQAAIDEITGRVIGEPWLEGDLWSDGTGWLPRSV